MNESLKGVMWAIKSVSDVPGALLIAWLVVQIVFRGPRVTMDK